MNRRPSYYTPIDGEPVPVPLDEVIHNHLNSDQRRVGLAIFPGNIRVSTVFLQIDHAWDDGPPILWETLVFGGPLNDEMKRYRSRADAEAGHKATVKRVAAAIGAPDLTA